MSNGFDGTVVGLLVGFLLRKHGIAVDQIAGVVALALLPQGWYRHSRIRGWRGGMCCCGARWRRQG